MAFPEIVVSNFDKTCRLCLSQEFNMISIFEPNVTTESEDLSTKINSSVNVEVAPDDGLPRQICKSCYQQLDAFYNFKIMCTNSEIALHQCIDNSTIKSPSEQLEYNVIVDQGEDYGIKLIAPDGTSLELETLHLTDSADISSIENISMYPGGDFETVGGLDASTLSPVEILEHLTCRFCKKLFTRHNNMKVHEKKFHKKELALLGQEELLLNDMHICSICSREFKRLDLLKTHQLRLHSSQRPFQCKVCCRGFVRKHDLQWHKKSHTKASARKKKPLTAEVKASCFNCCKTFTNELELSRHLENSCLRGTSIEIFKNINVDEQLLLPQTVTNCEKTVDSNSLENRCQKTYSCKMCSKVFSLKSNLLLHERNVHPEIGPYFCVFCGKMFLKLNCVRAHEKRHYSSKSFMCNICGKTFYNSSLLKVHEQIHTESKPFYCDICQLSFRTKTNLIVHMKRHSTNPNYVCKICGKKFLTVSGFGRHELVHKGIRSFKCKECDKGFITSIERDRHMKYHTGEKKHVCEHCGKMFFESSHLKVHVRIHTKERPYQCSECSGLFSSYSKLKRHRKLHCYLKPLKVVLSEETRVRSRSTLEWKDTDNDFVANDLITIQMEARPNSSIISNYQDVATPEQFNKRFNISRTEDLLLEDNLDYHIGIMDRMIKEINCQTVQQSVEQQLQILENEAQKAISTRQNKTNNLFDENNEERGNSLKTICFDVNESQSDTESTPICQNLQPKSACDQITEISDTELPLPFGSSLCVAHNSDCCNICSESFINKRLLALHKKSKHPQINIFECELCNLSFNRKSNLVVHLKRHSTESHHICHHCRKKFLTKSGLQRHISSHSGQKMFTCSFCGKQFISQFEVRRHENFHTGQRSFKCPYCDKKYFSSSYLSEHVLSHSKEQPYVCDVCQRRYVSKLRLNRHKKVHEIE